MNTIHIGKDTTEHIAINVLGKSHPDSNDYWDGNWLKCIVQVKAGAWRGKFKADLRTDEFHVLAEELNGLYNNLSGEVIFEPMEPWVKFKLVGDGRGYFSFEGEASDKLRTGNRLMFNFELDQTYLPNILKQLREVNKNYPVIGKNKKT